MQARAKGYMDAIGASRLKADPALIKHLKFSHEKKLVMKAILEIIQNKADAVLFLQNKLGVLGMYSGTGTTHTRKLVHHQF